MVDYVAMNGLCCMYHFASSSSSSAWWLNDWNLDKSLNVNCRNSSECWSNECRDNICKCPSGSSPHDDNRRCRMLTFFVFLAMKRMMSVFLSRTKTSEDLCELDFSQWCKWFLHRNESISLFSSISYLSEWFSTYTKILSMSIDTHSRLWQTGMS